MLDNNKSEIILRENNRTMHVIYGGLIVQNKFLLVYFSCPKSQILWQLRYNPLFRIYKSTFCKSPKKSICLYKEQILHKSHKQFTGIAIKSNPRMINPHSLNLYLFNKRKQTRLYFFRRDFWTFQLNKSVDMKVSTQ